MMLAMLGERIKRAREQAGLSQDDIARAVVKATGYSCSRSAVSQWETGDTKPKHAHEKLVAVADVCGVTIQWLLGRGDSVDEAGAPPAPSSLDYCDRAVIREMASALYATLEAEKLAARDPDDFADLLLTIHDWAIDEAAAGRKPDINTLRWMARTAKLARRE